MVSVESGEDSCGVGVGELNESNELLVRVLLETEPERHESRDGGLRKWSLDLPMAFSSQQISVGFKCVVS
jgi:hypothetical protein